MPRINRTLIRNSQNSRTRITNIYFNIRSLIYKYEYLTILINFKLRKTRYCPNYLYNIYIVSITLLSYFTSKI